MVWIPTLSMPRIIDLAVHEHSCYEPARKDESIYIDPIPYLIKKHLDHDSLATELEDSRMNIEFSIIPLATPEEHQEYRDNLIEWQTKALYRYVLRD